jgi:hypothetical protein
MNFTFLHHPEVRKFNYKPQFYVPKEEKPVNSDRFDPNQFGDKLRNNWQSKRRTTNNCTNNIRIIIWMAFLLLVLGLIGWKFLF